MKGSSGGWLRVLTDVVFHSLLKEFIDALSVALLLREADLILEPFKPDLCQRKKTRINQSNLVMW